SDTAQWRAPHLTHRKAPSVWWWGQCAVFYNAQWPVRPTKWGRPSRVGGHQIVWQNTDQNRAKRLSCRWCRSAQSPNRLGILVPSLPAPLFENHANALYQKLGRTESI